MDKVVFEVIDKESMLVNKCIYYEPDDNGEYYSVHYIDFSEEELSKLFHSFLKKYNENHFITDEELSTGTTRITFYDVDYDEMADIMGRLKEYHDKMSLNRMIQESIKRAQNEKALMEQKMQTRSQAQVLEAEPKMEQRIQTKSLTQLLETKPKMAQRPMKVKINKNKVKRKNKFDKRTIALVAAVVITASAPIIGFSQRNKVKVNTDSMDNDNPITIEEICSAPQAIIIGNAYKNNLIIEEDKTLDENSNTLENNNEEVVATPVPMETEPAEEETVIEDNNSYEEDYPVLAISAEDWVDTDKYFVARAYYMDTLTKYCNTYGLDPMLVMAIGTHERGVHSDTIDAGGGLGLFQIQVSGGWNWLGRNITAYNFDTGEYETEMITLEKAQDVFTNMKLACMMLQDLLRTYNYNVAEAVMAYNYGTTNVDKVLNYCSNDTGFTRGELNQMDNLEWLKYRNIIGGGDPNYLENVFKYIPNDTVLKFKKPDGSECFVRYENVNKNVLTH